ncbi:hypothetical protein GF327_03720 [Candidatus Woesearchaeota archaeon]|nr:hypothetical protein [Candidatus Woesearchaeota archaeon]
MKKIILVFSVITFLLLFIFSSLLFFDELKLINNRITGAAELDTAVIIINVSSAVCSSNFSQGYNLVSIPCVPKPAPVSEVLESVEENIVSIHHYVPSSADPWKTYNPELPSWAVQDLTEIDRKKSYWLNLDSNVTFQLNSSTASPNYIYTKQGWNMIGYPTLTPVEIGEALVSINQSYDILYSYNTLNNSWEEYTWNSSKSSEQNIINMTPYTGYWIKMLRNETLLIDW